MSLNTKLLTGLIILGIIDVIIPLPILAFILIYILLKRPPWFFEYVNTIYAKHEQHE